MLITPLKLPWNPTNWCFLVDVFFAKVFFSGMFLHVARAFLDSTCEFSGGVAFFKLVDGVAYSLEDHKAWFRRAGALEGLGRTLWS